MHCVGHTICCERKRSGTSAAKIFNQKKILPWTHNTETVSLAQVKMKQSRYVMQFASCGLKTDVLSLFLPSIPCLFYVRLTSKHCVLEMFEIVIFMY